MNTKCLFMADIAIFFTQNLLDTVTLMVLLLVSQHC